MTHDELVLRGEKWLEKEGCKVVIRDECRIYVESGERPDVIGWRAGVSIVVEVKISRGDFLQDRGKEFRLDPSLGMGDWRFYLCPQGIINPSDLPAGWGLLYAYPKIIKRVYGVPTNCLWSTEKPFVGNRQCENMLLVSALRRLALRGYLKEIYGGNCDGTGR